MLQKNMYSLMKITNDDEWQTQSVNSIDRDSILHNVEMDEKRTDKVSPKPHFNDKASNYESTP